MHAAAALDDLAAGCDLVFGATLEGGWYLAALREPRPELLTVAQRRARAASGPRSGAPGSWAPRSACCATSALLATPGDAAACSPTRCSPRTLRAALSA